MSALGVKLVIDLFSDKLCGWSAKKLGKMEKHTLKDVFKCNQAERIDSLIKTL